MADVIRGADVAQQLKDRMKAQLKQSGITPVLAVVRVGEDGSNIAYEKGVLKTCASTGIEVRTFSYPESIDQQDLEKAFRKINEDPEIHGILLLRPLPAHLQENVFTEMIDPEKDMDCMSPSNWAKLVMGEPDGYYPCTAEAVIQMCDYMGVDFNGARAVVIGRSQVIGKPLGLMLLARNATLTWCHSRTKDLPAMCKDAQILVSACGVAGLVGEEIAKGLAPGCVCVDVGVNFVDGKMCGDFVYEEVAGYAGKITPVPGGVGAVTNTVLADHVVRAALKQQKKRQP